MSQSGTPQRHGASLFAAWNGALGGAYVGSHFSWEPGFDANFLLSQFKSIRNISAGKVSWVGGEYRFWKPVFYSSIRASRDASPKKRRCIDAALNDPSTSLSDRDAFLERCESAYVALASTPGRRFVLLTHVTYEGANLAGRVMLPEGGLITWNPSRRSRFLKRALREREMIADRTAALGISVPGQGLTPVLALVSAHGHMEAHRRAIDAVDEFRGLLNLMINSTRQPHYFGDLFSGPKLPFNRFLLGPLSTLHEEDGSLAGDTFWYEPGWQQPPGSTVKFADEKAARLNVSKWLRLCRANILQPTVAEALVRYCRALDNRESGGLLVSLWGVLEFLTDTQNERYAVTVSRVSKLFTDHLEAKTIADHIRLRRNATVHADRSPDSDELDIIVHQADLLASQLLFFYIRNQQKFENKQDLIHFLDLPLGVERLKRARRLIDQFVKYQNRKPPAGKPQE